ncbi:MAG: ATP--guanido phosphotransferase, partial [Armatimonadota bacterium]
SNRYGIGKSETDILTEVEAVVKHLITSERSARHRLYKEQRLALEDVVWRAYGVLSHARSISSEEALEMLSRLRLGQLLEIVPVKASLLKRLMLVIQPGMLQTIVGPVYSPSERDRRRADALRSAITRGELESLSNCPI